MDFINAGSFFLVFYVSMPREVEQPVDIIPQEVYFLPTLSPGSSPFCINNIVMGFHKCLAMNVLRKALFKNKLKRNGHLYKICMMLLKKGKHGHPGSMQNQVTNTVKGGCSSWNYNNVFLPLDCRYLLDFDPQPCSQLQTSCNWPPFCFSCLSHCVKLQNDAYC